jgi:hypothetical protein
MEAVMKNRAKCIAAVLAGLITIGASLGWADKDGQKADPVKMGLPPDIPQEVRHVVTFKDVGGKTELTVTEYGYKSDQTLDLSKQGLEQCLDKMAAALGGKHERKEERKK